MSTALTLLDFDGAVARLTLNRPERHNSLVPELIASLLDNLRKVASREGLRALILQAAGRSFSTGGDVEGFHATPREKRRAYADTLVGGLNEAIIALLDLPVPVIGRVQGPVTGGSLGLMLACDLVAMAPQAFIQPYYVQVGFSPDGGWTALLPDRIGAAKAREIQLLNRRIMAAEAVQLGLATSLVEPESLDATIDSWLTALTGNRPAATAHTKRLLCPPERRAAVVAALDAEKQMFLTLIDGAEAEAGMAQFLRKSA
ncbi:MAG TPA: enoyl-CoA hydratase/isomerase family protein [Ferrovibrio sp.]|jgi:2-(1,2-epoxy-1,2-dihydrophenyl)acetyl-CoA isomerase|uniref:enoyl-CoA hydratase/isomerase family protein n=1 Tax=Ferrovibrio sp. TaxID=1917215 RepID=UPI002B4AECE9|nr:enoyl-CoA hydratase/isomerase family protein [Ferrovibrio sp.]HLT77350.1 enoyl-CoA hydratase/isomerase family protein [Ferrovibrio sp.]